MKIVYISNSIIPSRTANSIHVMKMCQAFADNGHDVVLLAPDATERYEPGVEDIYEYYGVKKSFQVKKLFYPNIKGKNIIYNLGILYFLLINRDNLVYGRYLFGCYLSSIIGRKTILESHAPFGNNSGLELIIFKKLIKSKKFDKLVVISQELKNIYIKNGYLNDGRILVAHDGADEVVNLDSKLKLNGKNDSLKVGYVGHLYKGKGVEIIDNIADKTSNDVEFHIIGGFEKDIKYWKDKIKSENVFFYGFVQQKEVSMYINSLDVCLLPNQKIVLPNGAKDDTHNISTFTSPLKMFEYMAHKKAIISSNIKVLREVLTDKMSILVNPENNDEWIDAIEQMKDDRLREKLSSNAFKEFKKFTWKVRASSVIK